MTSDGSVGLSHPVYPIPPIAQFQHKGKSHMFGEDSFKLERKVQ